MSTAAVASQSADFAANHVALLLRLLTHNLLRRYVLAETPALATGARVQTLSGRRCPSGCRACVRSRVPSLSCRSEPAVPPKPPDLPPHSQFLLARSMCYGACPVYGLEIHGDGTVIYTGDAHVRGHRRRTKTILPEAVRGLVGECLASGLLARKGRCKSMATDLAGARITIEVGTVKKTIDDNGPDEESLYGADADVRRRLAAIEHRIDAVTESAEWVVSVRTRTRGYAASGDHDAVAGR